MFACLHVCRFACLQDENPARKSKKEKNIKT